MNIRWSAAAQRFEAEFQDFTGDLDAVKVAGFKYDGSTRVWHTQRIAVLNKIRAKKPASGLTITPEALEVYKPLAAQEEKNAEVRKQLAEVRKQQKKDGVISDLSQKPSIPDGVAWIGAEHLPPYVSISKPYIRPPQPNLPRCTICADPVYFYENQSVPICLWCELHPGGDFV